MSSKRYLLLALAVCTLVGALQAQAPTATLTITHNGSASGAVGVRSTGPGNQSSGNVCNPNPGGGPGGSCQFTFPVGASLRLMANSPGTPGIFIGGMGDAASCATSVCEFTLNSDSAITAMFEPGAGPFPSLTIALLGDGTGNVGADNNQCQNFELGFSACTTYYAAGSSAMVQGRSMPGNIFAGFSGGTGNAGGCAGTENCAFMLLEDSSVDASFSAMSSAAVDPGTRTITVGNNAFFNTIATFTNGMTRPGFQGNTPWQGHTPMDVERFSLAAAVVGDRLYAIGGADGSCGGGGPCPFGPLATVEAFDPTVTMAAAFEQAWTPRASMAAPRESLAAAVVGGIIYAIGGHTSGGGAVASAEAYDPQADAWSTRAPMSGPRARTAAAVIGNTIYVVGGITTAGGGAVPPVSTVESYDPATDTWTTRASMLTARNLPAAASVNGILYVIGGDAAASVEAYDPASDTWTAKAPMPNGGGSHQAVALNGLIYAVGGSPMAVKVYNPAVDSWAALTSFSPLPVSGQFALAVLDGRLFAAGGNLSGGTAVATVSANRPPETTWWSSNSAVGRINPGNNGGVNGLSAGTATISARLVAVDSGAQSALLTVNPSGGGSTIFVSVPGQVFTEVGHASWGCGTFNQNAPGPWTVTVNYGEGGGVESLPFITSPPAGTCSSPGSTSTGAFFFNHAYGSPGTFHVVVTVRNTATNASTTREFDVVVEEAEPEDCAPIVSNITAVGTVPFQSVQVKVFDRPSNQLLFEGALPFGIFDDAALPAGQYRIEFSVPAGYIVAPSSFIVDAICGQTITLNATVQAVTPPPTIAVAASPHELWPPNNKMRTITVDVDASAGAIIELVSITSNEPGGAADIDGAAFGTDDRTFQLRAKRLGGGSGRVYTVTYRATNAGGTTTVSTTVVVPHDQGK